MPISDWFKARGERSYTAVTPDGRSDVADGVWVKCAGCKHTVYQGELERTEGVCPYCSHHFELGARDRIGTLADDGSFAEMDAALTSSDPLGFTGTKPYPLSLSGARERTGLLEAVVTGRAAIDGVPVVLGAMDFGFIAASMGSVVGEKIARAFDVAAAEGRPLVLVCTSGGARMQEGMLSLMQMAKTASAARRLAEAGVPYVSVLTDPTLGGVTASFATLADVVLAEPGAKVGFTGRRVIEQTIKQHLPRDFQSAEFSVAHGMVDAVVAREELRETIALVLRHLTRTGATGDGSAS